MGEYNDSPDPYFFDPYGAAYQCESLRNKEKNFMSRHRDRRLANTKEHLELIRMIEEHGILKAVEMIKIKKGI